jgi:hypothetical protein
MDGFLFWKAVVPLSSVRQFSQLSVRLSLWSAAACCWYAGQAIELYVPGTIANRIGWKKRVRTN